MLVTLCKIGDGYFRLLRTNGFHVKAESERCTAASSRGRQNLKYEISRRYLADYVNRLRQKACCTCSTIIFPHGPIKSLISSIDVAVPVDVSLKRALSMQRFGQRAATGSNHFARREGGLSQIFKLIVGTSEKRPCKSGSVRTSQIGKQNISGCRSWLKNNACSSFLNSLPSTIVCRMEFSILIYA